MAGAFTHMAVVDTAKIAFAAETQFGKILREQIQFLTLGSVSPDIPYLSHLAGGGSNYANIMHYHNTNSIVHNGLHSLNAAKSRDKTWRAQIAWLAGFVSHLVVDATIHPIVESIVGPYTDPSARSSHTECEMLQDVMIFREVKNLDLNDSEYTGHLRDCLTNKKILDAVAEFWADLVLNSCPAAGKPEIQSLTSSYTNELDLAEGSAFGRLLRHVGAAPAYYSYDELTNNQSVLVDRYYKNVQLPTGQKGSFKEEGFQRAVKNLQDVWSRFERAIFSTENIAQIVPNWNLDTGVDQSTNSRTYWG